MDCTLWKKVLWETIYMCIICRSELIISFVFHSQHSHLKEVQIVVFPSTKLKWLYIQLIFVKDEGTPEVLFLDALNCKYLIP